MDKSLNHECVICGTKYNHCDSCGKIKSFTPWRTICDTQKHYQMFCLINDYQHHLISKEEAKETLEYIGFTMDEKQGLKESVQAIIDDIYTETDSINETVVTSVEVEPEVVSKKKSKSKI